MTSARRRFVFASYALTLLACAVDDAGTDGVRPTEAVGARGDRDAGAPRPPTTTPVALGAGNAASDDGVDSAAGASGSAAPVAGGSAGAATPSGTASMPNGAGMPGAAGMPATPADMPRAGTPGTGDPSPDAGATGTPPAVRRYDFEQDVQGWRDLRGEGSDVRRSMARSVSGQSSLQIELDVGANDGGDSATRYIGVPSELTPELTAGQTLTFSLWVPRKNGLVGVQPFVVSKGHGVGSPGVWAGTWRHVDTLSLEEWTTIDVHLPTDFPVGDLEWVGVQVVAKPAGWKGSIDVDAVTF